MIRYILSTLCALAATASAAITEKYVTSGAGGSGDGTSGNPYTLSQMITEINGGAAAGNRYNVLVGTYTRGAADTITGSGTSSAPVIIRGYGSAIGDGYQGRTLDNGALVTTNMPLISYSGSGRLSVTGTWVLMESVRVVSAASNPSASFGNDSAVAHCILENSSTNGSASCLTVSSRGVVFNSDVYMSGASGGSTAITATSASCRVLGNRIRVTSSTCPAVTIQSSTVVAKNTIFGGGGVGIAITATSSANCIIDNTIVGCAGDGIDMITGSTNLQFIAGNMITDNTGNGVDLVSSANAVFMAANRFRDNAASVNSGSDWVTATRYMGVDSGTTGDTSTDYENYGAFDFRLKNTSPATSAGIPLKASIGANQRDQTGAGGGGPVEHAHTFIQ